jgi:hypothetical protein
MKTPVPSGQMKGVFLVSIWLMGVHKIESYQTREWDFAPSYRYFLNLDLSKGETLFLAFVVMLFIGLFWV